MIGFNFQTCIPEEYNFPYDDCSKFINILYKSEYLSLIPGKFIRSAKDISVGIKIFNNTDILFLKRNIKYKIKNSNKNKKLALSPVNTENISKIKKIGISILFFFYFFEIIISKGIINGKNLDK